MVYLIKFKKAEEVGLRAFFWIEPKTFHLCFLAMVTVFLICPTKSSSVPESPTVAIIVFSVATSKFEWLAA